MKKYFLVDPVRYELLTNSFNAQKSSSSRDQLFTHPNVKKTKELDGEIDKILRDKNLSDYEKNEQFSNKLNDFVTNFRTSITTPKNEALLGKPTLDDEFSMPAPSLPSLEDNLSSIPDSYQQSAKKLIRFIKNSGSFSWNENGQLIYKGKLIPGSDVGQLLNDAVRNKKIVSNEETFENFLSALKSEGYPIQKILNRKKTKLPSFRVEQAKKRYRKPKGQFSMSKNKAASILKSWVESQ